MKHNIRITIAAIFLASAYLPASLLASGNHGKESHEMPAMKSSDNHGHNNGASHGHDEKTVTEKHGHNDDKSDAHGHRSSGHQESSSHPQENGSMERH